MLAAAALVNTRATVDRSVGRVVAGARPGRWLALAWHRASRASSGRNLLAASAAGNRLRPFEPPSRLEVAPMATASSLAPVVRSANEGESRWFYGGGVYTWKATTEETGGAFFLFEDRMEQGKMTPLHTHPDSDESMYVLEGEILMHMDGEEHRIASGGLAVAPRGVPHALLVLSDFARLLCLHTPGACQAFYLDASEPSTPAKLVRSRSTSPGYRSRRSATAAL